MRAAPGLAPTMFHPADEADTVVALATARAPGARAVVRVAGPAAIPCAAAAFEPAAALAGAPGGSVVVGAVTILGARLPAAAWVFRAPRSFTGGDVVELHLPSCLPLVDALVEALVAASARPARPGELTRRAFLAGKLDLASAEAVHALSISSTAEEARAALLQLRGGLGAALAGVREAALAALTRVEAALDFADEDLDHALIADGAVLERIDGALGAIADLLGRERGREAESARPRVVLYGPPNAGKSSLLNALAGREVALASPIAGTTRDAVEARIVLAGAGVGGSAGAGAAVDLVDGAGVGGPGDLGASEWPEGFGDARQAGEARAAGAAGAAGEPGEPGDAGEARAAAEVEEARAVDRESVARARRALRSAHLVVVVLDGAAPLDAAGRAALADTAAGPRLVVLQKSDRPRRLVGASLEGGDPAAPAPIAVSAHTGAGLDDLRIALASALAGLPQSGEPALAPNARHRAALAEAARSLEAARSGLAAGQPSELAAIDLRASLDALESITGLGTTTEDLLDRVFVTFCIGK